MRLYLAIVGILFFTVGCSDTSPASDLESLLKDQLTYSHSTENWYVPTQIAIDGLTTEQVNWKDSTGNHSIGELISHITFWNELHLREFNGNDFSGFDIQNDSTFVIYSEKDWKRLTTKLDSVQSELIRIMESASEEQLSKWATNMLNIASHNAYHVGQILYIRKQNGWWSRK
ncbi:MAG: DinB family protein [Bacteroidota bacterium]